MAVRSTMAALIYRTRLLINDPNPAPSGATLAFPDQDVQDALDATRLDIFNGSTTPRPTFVTGTIQYLDYFADYGDWEDDLVLKQYLTIVVTPSLSENIVGHWQFAASTLPEVYITGKTYDVYRAAADLLERLASRWMLAYSFSADGQSFRREQAFAMIEKRINTLRAKQRAGSLALVRSDIVSPEGRVQTGLGPLEIDYMANGTGH